ncbi:serine/threonine protein kinase, partial [Streptomyces sp. NPDC052693]
GDGRRGRTPVRGTGAARGGTPSRSGARPTPTGRNGTRPGGGSRSAPHSGTGRPAPRNTGTGLRPANPRLLRQRLFVFVVVTLLVAVGIALVQGCQGPARGLGGDGAGVRQEQVQPDSGPPGHGS